MKKRIFFLAFFISFTTNTALNETSLLSLPNELIYYIFDFISHKNVCKNITISKNFYNSFYDYLLYKQNVLLSKPNISEKEKNEIIFNNRLLLGYSRNNEKEINHEERNLKNWTHGKLKYIFTEDFDALFYVPNVDVNKKLYKIWILSTGHLELPDKDIDFLEWYYPENHKKDLTKIINLSNLKTNTQIIRFSSSLPHKHILSASLKALLKKTPYVKLLFSHPTPLSLPGDFNKLDIVGAITEIYFDKRIDSWQYSGPKNRKTKKPSLSLQLLINENTNDNCFADISGLDYLKKLSLNFDKNSISNEGFYGVCPRNLETLVLKNCASTICIPRSLKKLKIISPKKCCVITPSLPNDNSRRLGFENIGYSAKSALTQFNLNVLHLENDRYGYMKNILKCLKISQLPEKLIIENCSYTNIRTISTLPSIAKKLENQLCIDHR